MKNIAVYTIFASSPSDTIKERDILSETVQKLNEEFEQNGFRVKLIRYERDIYPSRAEFPQKVIDDQVNAEYEVFIGLMYARFGTPTPYAGSGTEHEFNIAIEKHQADKSSVEIMMYFNDEPVPQHLLDPEQFAKVNGFKERVSKLGILYCPYKGHKGFKKKIEDDLRKCLRDFHRRKKNVSPKSEEVISYTKIDDNPINLADYAIQMHKEGKIVEYRSFISKNKLSDKLKRIAAFEKLRDLAEVDLKTSLRTKEAKSILRYAQACYVLYDLEEAIDVIHKKLHSDPLLDTYSLRDQVGFIRIYAEILSELGQTELAISLLESVLLDGLIAKIPHSHFFHVMGTLSTLYFAVGNIEGAYDIAQDVYDEQRYTINRYGTAISGTRLGIILLEMNKAEEAITFFESAIEFFKSFDVRACAWSQVYYHICTIRLGYNKTENLKSAMEFYSQHCYLKKETIPPLNEIKNSGVGWDNSFDNVVQKFYEKVNSVRISPDKLQTAEDFCKTLAGRMPRDGANGLNSSVSNGDFSPTSMLSKTYIKSLNKDIENSYMDKIKNNDKFYLSPFLNYFVRTKFHKKVHLIKNIVIPKLSEISESKDTFRLFYADFLEYNQFINEAAVLIESVENKETFKYLNIKANIMSRSGKIDLALEYYEKAVTSTTNNYEKAKAYHNQAFLIHKHAIVSRYEEAKKLCMLAIDYRPNHTFWYPVQTFALLQIRKESVGNTSSVLQDCHRTYQLSIAQLGKIVNEVEDSRKRQAAEKFFYEIMKQEDYH